MKKLIYCLMAMVAVCSMTSCDKDWNDINPRKVIISDVNIECIKEGEGVHAPTSGLEYTSHTYKCTGNLDGFAGSCYIVISEPIKG
ncbi:MAG: hypothetical protein J6U45_07920, partial [Alistipes sp.]|nr:hypothetical protein [Alistipes sp.]